MAAVRRRGAYDFAHKTYSHYLIKGENKQAKGAIQASSPSAGFLLSDIQNGELYGAENAVGRVTVGVSQDSCIRVTPLFVAEHDSYFGLNTEYSLPIKPQDQSIEGNVPRYRSYASFRRMFCTFRSAPRLQSRGGRRLSCGHGRLVCVRAYSGNGTQSEPLYKTKTGYYEILGVTPTATQAQIKTSYYKQSFIYHPDRNAGSEVATVRFSEISEAYTVLGNKALRRKYDRGLLSRSDLVATARPSGKDTSGSSAKLQTDSRRSVVGAGSRGGVFDFDKFFKVHYSEQLQREKDIRVRKEEMLKKKRETIGEKKMGRMLEMGVGLMLAMAVAILISLKQR